MATLYRISSVLSLIFVFAGFSFPFAFWNSGSSQLTSANLYSAWNMDGSAGSNEVSYYGTSSTLTNSGTVPSSAGIIDGSRGPLSDDNYLYSTSSAFDAQTFMWDFWVYYDFTGVGTIANKSDAGVNFGYHLYLEGSVIKLGVGSGSERVYVGTTSIPHNAWHHILVAKYGTGGTTTVAFVDAVRDTGFEAQNSVTMTAPTGETLYIGRYRSAGYSYPGYLDELAYYNSAPATLAEIQSLATARYNSGAGRKFGQ